MTTDVERRTTAAPGLVPAALAVMWTLIALVAFALLPFSSSESIGQSSDGTTFSTTSQETLIENEGIGVVMILLVPVAVALVGLVGVAFRLPALSAVVAAIAFVLCVVAILSIGFFYLPASVLLLIGAIRSTSRRTEVIRRGASR